MYEFGSVFLRRIAGCVPRISGEMNTGGRSGYVEDSGKILNIYIVVRVLRVAGSNIENYSAKCQWGKSVL